MNPPAFVDLLMVIAGVSLGTYVFAAGRGATVSRVFCIMCLLCAYNALMAFGYAAAESFETANFWRRLDVLWPFVVSAAAHLVLAFTGRSAALRRATTYLFVYGPPMAVSAILLLGNPATGPPVKDQWGWSPGAVQASILLAPAVPYFTALTLLSVALTVRFWLSTREPEKRPQAKYLFFGLLLVVVAPAVTEGLLPAVGIKAQWTSSALGLLGCALFAFAIGRHRLFVVTPQSAVGAILTTMSDAVFLVDNDGKIVSVNRGASMLLGWPAGELAGKPISEFLGAEGSDETAYSDVEMAELARVSTAGDLETTVNSRSTGKVPVSLSVSTVRVAGRDTASGRVYVARDITERKRAEAERASLAEQVAQGQKLEAIGTLASGIAHDFNNLLTPILGHANLLKREAKPESELYEAAQVVEQAASRASELTKQLLGFARKGKWQNTQVDVHTVVDQVVAILSRTIDKRITIVRRWEARSAVVMGDPSQLQQVVMNLAVNAIDALPEGGELTFETSNSKFDEESCRQHPGVHSGPYLRFCVRDTGTGIPREIRQRIFEPFFTTKSTARGTGMGLATVYGIVKSHGGSIDVSSEPGSGTEFTALLPLAEKSALADEDVPSEKPTPGSGRVLVVDDEPTVRKIVAVRAT